MPTGKVSLALLLFVTGASLFAEEPARVLRANAYRPGIPYADGSWHGLAVGSDDNVYLGLCTHSLDRSAVLLRFNLATRQFRTLGDMGEVTGTPTGPGNFLPQGKIHTPFFEHEGRLYFATHRAHEQPVPDRQPYPGGCLVAFDMKTEKLRVLGRAPENEGIITLAADFPRRKLYALTHPSGLFLIYDLTTRRITNLGPIAPAAAQPFYVCRTLGVDPRDGRVYGVRPNGELFVYRPGADQLEPLPVDLRAGIVGEQTAVTTNTLVWRSIRFDSVTGAFYATHFSTASLYRLDPATLAVKALTRLAHPDRTGAGVAKLAFVLGPDRRLYHLTPGSNPSALYLVSYDLETGATVNHGLLHAGDLPVHDCDSLAVTPAGILYALATVAKPTSPVTYEKQLLVIQLTR